ncbi:MAG: CRTAC1 family protein [Deltaproteobacteria bacterium]|nr:CRTAC1 family protein [Deltaproteobacteria bacterium]
MKLRSNGRRLGCIVALALLAGVVWVGYPFAIPLLNPIAEETRARQVFREAKVRNAWRLLRTGMSGEVGNETWNETRSEFHRDHTLAEACVEATRWADARINRARGMLQDVLSGSRPDAEPVVAAARVLLENELADEAKQLLERRIEGYLAQGGSDLGPVPDMVLRTLAEVDLRDGELVNCLRLHNPDRCLYPLAGDAAHEMAGPVKAAAGLFGVLLARDRGDPAARWRAGLSAALAGQRTDLPIAPAPRWNPQPPPLPPFPEISTEVGLRRLRAAGGTVLDDFDEDGDLDILLLSYLPCDPALFMLNRGDGSFADATAGSGLESELGGFNAAQADVNNDGHLDVVIARSGWGGTGRNSLLLGDGHGHFEDVTRRAGLDADNDATMSAQFTDYDGDGWIDLFLANLSLENASGSRSRLYRNRGDGTFEDATFAAGLPSIRFATGVAWGDYDDDGRPDLYVSVVLGPNLLFRNEGGGRFADVTAKAGVLAPLVSFATWFFDYDNDGHLDLWADSYWVVLRDGVESLVDGRDADPASIPRLYRNRGDGTFEDRTRALGVDAVMSAMGANFGDLDGDGWLDIYVGTGTPSLSHLVPNRLFHNVRGERFEDATVAARVGHLQKGHGVAFGDVDGDRNVDLLVNLGGAIPIDRYGPALFHNPLLGHHVTEVELRGTRSNAAALGARITAWLADGRRVERVVGSGGSFGASPLRQSIGLGDAAGIDRLEIRWPSGSRESVSGLAGGARYRIVEGEGHAVQMPAPPPRREAPVQP